MTYKDLKKQRFCSSSSVFCAPNQQSLIYETPLGISNQSCSPIRKSQGKGFVERVNKTKLLWAASRLFVTRWFAPECEFCFCLVSLAKHKPMGKTGL